eukprot:scaffold109748_cov63-Phaeocystis_antarctica.AAC.2
MAIRAPAPSAQSRRIPALFRHSGCRYSLPPAIPACRRPRRCRLRCRLRCRRLARRRPRPRRRPTRRHRPAHPHRRPARRR